MAWLQDCYEHGRLIRRTSKDYELPKIYDKDSNEARQFRYGWLYQDLWIEKWRELRGGTIDVEELKDKLTAANAVVEDLLDALPDASKDDCWDWCWNELNHKAQEHVKACRKRAESWRKLQGGDGDE